MLCWLMDWPARSSTCVLCAGNSGNGIAFMPSWSAQRHPSGTPFQKPQHRLGQGIVGLDLGPSTVAVVAEQDALLQPFCPEVAPDAKALRRLERHLDRQRRANNPEHYDARGRIKRGRRHWKVSRRQYRVQARRREVYRKLAATRKRSHGQLAHRVLALGSSFHLERVSYRAWQKLHGRSVYRSASGAFVLLLSRLAASAGGQVCALTPQRAKLSQTCHCGVVQKKPLRQRWHICACGVSPPSGTSTAPIWPALSSQPHPCWRRARPQTPGELRNRCCRRPTSTPP